jgi:hypothetical protein
VALDRLHFSALPSPASKLLSETLHETAPMRALTGAPSRPSNAISSILIGRNKDDGLSSSLDDNNIFVECLVTRRETNRQLPISQLHLANLPEPRWS